jgi:hypothetical protein
LSYARLRHSGILERIAQSFCGFGPWWLRYSMAWHEPRVLTTLHEMATASLVNAPLEMTGQSVNLPSPRTGGGVGTHTDMP